jgi:hypothetical protein
MEFVPVNRREAIEQDLFDALVRAQGAYDFVAPDEKVAATEQLKKTLKASLISVILLD